MENNKKELDIMTAIQNAIDEQYNDTNGAVATETQPTDALTQTPVYENAEAYRAATGRRFRMTKEEIAQFGSTTEGRQEAFMNRQNAGNLPQ